MIEKNIFYRIIIIKSEVWTIIHCLGLGREKWYALYVSPYSYHSLYLFKHDTWN